MKASKRRLFCVALCSYLAFDECENEQAETMSGSASKSIGFWPWRVRRKCILHYPILSGNIMFRQLWKYTCVWVSEIKVNSKLGKLSCDNFANFLDLKLRKTLLIKIVCFARSTIFRLAKLSRMSLYFALFIKLKWSFLILQMELLFVLIFISFDQF